MKLLKKDYIDILKHYNVIFNENIPINLLRKTTENIIAKKLCKCTKKVKNKDVNKDESRAIAICNNSVVLKKNLRINSFKCKNKAELNSLKNKKNQNKLFKNSQTIKLIPKNIPKKKYKTRKKNYKN